MITNILSTRFWIGFSPSIFEDMSWGGIIITIVICIIILALLGEFKDDR